MSEPLVIPLEIDLSHFSRWLAGRGVLHRIVEEDGGQVILLHDAGYQEQVRQVLGRYLSDESFRARLIQDLETGSQDGAEGLELSPEVSGPSYMRARPAQAPIIFFLIGFSLLIAYLTSFGQGGPILRAMLIVDPFQASVDMADVAGRWQALLEVIDRGEIWRLVSPDFLHFNVMHITFNLLIIWILGGQLEAKNGSVQFASLVFFVSVVSNVAQLLDSGYLFGGLSGVAYGLVGYCWLWKSHDAEIFFPPALLKISLIWLMIGYTSLPQWLGIGQMANSAHLLGLFAGLIWAGLNLLLVKASHSVN